MNPLQPRRLALLCFGGIGDVILFSPVIEHLHQQDPELKLTLFVEARSASVGPLLPNLEKVIPLQIDPRKRLQTFMTILKTVQQTMQTQRGWFEGILSTGSSPFIPLLLWATGIPVRIGYASHPLMQKLLTHPAPLNTQQYAGNMYAALAKAYRPSREKETTDTVALPNLSPPSEELRHWAATLLNISALNTAAKTVLIHPGSSKLSVEKRILKAWAPEHWASLIRQLSTHAAVFLVGGPDDQPVIEAIEVLLAQAPPQNYTNLYGKTKNLSEFAALVAASDLLISIDSSPLHIAVGLHHPVLAFFGPTDERKLTPNVPWVRVVSKEKLTCRPCLWDARAHSCEQPVCLDISVEQLLQAAYTCLENTLQR